MRDCLAYPLALGDATLAGRALIEQVLAQASFDLDPRLVSNSVETMKAFARMNRGVCFQFRKPGKAIIPPGDMIALPLTDRRSCKRSSFLQPDAAASSDRGRRFCGTAQGRFGLTPAERSDLEELKKSRRRLLRLRRQVWE